MVSLSVSYVQSLSSTQDSEHARFRTWTLPYIASIPLIVVVWAVLWLGLRRLLPRAPNWASNFVKETVDSFEATEEPSSRLWSRGRVPLTIVSALGLALYVVVWSGRVHHVPSTLIAASWVWATSKKRSLLNMTGCFGSTHCHPAAPDILSVSAAPVRLHLCRRIHVAGRTRLDSHRCRHP